jgi:hypothetical protein
MLAIIPDKEISISLSEHTLIIGSIKELWRKRFPLNSIVFHTHNPSYKEFISRSREESGFTA